MTEPHRPVSSGADPSSFSALLSQLRHDGCVYRKPACVALLHLATLGGKLSFDDAVDSLVPFEKTLLHAVIGRTELVVRPTDADALESSAVIIKHSAFGKLAMYDIQSAHEAPEDEVLIGTLLIEPAILDRAILAARAAELVEVRLREPLDELLSRWYEQRTLPDKIRDVRRWVNQFDALYTYVGRRLYSRAAGAISTLAAEDRFTELARLDPLRWAPEDRLFIAAAHMLTASGGPARMEEFNGKQLTATSVRHWLSSRVQLYRAASQNGCDDPASDQDDIIELARTLGSLARSLDQSGWVRFRRINGLSLVKTEHIFRPTTPSSGHGSQPVGAGTTLAAHGRRAAAMPSPVDRANTVQDELELLLRSAMEDMGADFVMSSGIRDPSRLRHDPAVLLKGPDALRRNDFYCCVLPAARTSVDRPAVALGELLIAIARRMEFNRWHFVPGNYPDEAIPPDRHHFRPPLLPDLTEWSNLRHGGHIEARVRYSVRLPGPPAWSEPAVLYGRSFRGIYDLRLYRMQEPPFTSGDLSVGLHYCSLLDSYLKAVYRTFEESGCTGPLFDRYTTTWYRAGCWQTQQLPTPARVPAHAGESRDESVE